MSPQLSRVATLNDTLRTTFLTGKVLVTEGVQSLSVMKQSEIMTRVREFSEFSENNDPYGEHDFGALDINGVGKIFWKVDYYNRTLDGGSEDPADPSKTTRVLTIMLASEY
jgi:hypothetical protein